MNRNRKVRIISYTIAAGVLAGTASMGAEAAPLAGATAMVSTSTQESSDSSTAAASSTLSGINLAMANMVSGANVSAENALTSSSSDTTATSSSEASAQTDTAASDQSNEFSNIAISQVTDYVNIRSAASEDSDVVGKLYNNCAATVEGTEGDWYKITSGNCTGYVKSCYVVVGDENLARSVATRNATVNTQTLYVRTSPSTDASVLGMVPGGEVLTVTDESTAADGWVKVSIEEGEGYVSTQYVTLSTEFKYAESKEEEEARLAKEEAEREAAAAAAAKASASKSAKSSSSKSSSSQSSSSKSSSSKTYSAASGSSGSAVVSYASQFVGNPYVYGGSSLTNGTDCSGFVMSVYGAFGVSLPHSSSGDRSVGYAVSTDDMQPGDIVCYSGHVAIYAGNGQIVHASNPSDGIKYSNVNYRKILAVRRIY